MLRVHTVSGPSSADVGDAVSYRVSAFNQPSPDPAEAGAVSWLIKSLDGAALGHFVRKGPVLALTVPDAWAGQRALVMPYMRSPSAAVAVRTDIGDRHTGAPAPGGLRHVEVVKEGSRFYASVNGDPRFYLGTEVRYGQRRGLMNSANPPGNRYRPEEYERAHGDWAWYLFPTIMCESKGHFTCLNTYDRACFTFGHIQLAAHTPDDNFAIFFREALDAPAAAEYFPDLVVEGGRIHRRTNSGLEALETAASTEPLMRYFNDTPTEVDTNESDRSARLVHWAMRDRAIRDLQVAFTVREQRRKLARHAKALPLSGAVDKLCVVVLDILHQGRSRYPSIGAALRAADPFDALLSLGASQYGERVATLRSGIRDLEAQERIGRKVYDARSGEFVLPDGV